MVGQVGFETLRRAVKTAKSNLNIRLSNNALFNAESVHLGTQYLNPSLKQIEKRVSKDLSNTNKITLGRVLAHIDIDSPKDSGVKKT